MIISRSYNCVPGLNYIQDPDLAFATIYIVKKNGTQFDEYISGSSNRTYIFNNSEGKVYFPEVFGVEKVYVLFKSVGGSDTCEMVSITDSDMPDAVVNVSYSKSFPYFGTEPVSLNIISKPSWAVVGLSMFNRLTIMGFPDVAGSETLQVELTNCGGTLTINKTFETLPNTNNIFVNGLSFSRITNVTGISYVVSSGSFPVFAGNVLSGIHPGYSGVISVSVSSIIFPRVLTIYKNGAAQESIPVPSNGLYAFAAIVFLSTDIINIELS